MSHRPANNSQQQGRILIYSITVDIGTIDFDHHIIETIHNIEIFCRPCIRAGQVTLWRPTVFLTSGEPLHALTHTRTFQKYPACAANISFSHSRLVDKNELDTLLSMTLSDPSVSETSAKSRDRKKIGA